MAAFTIEFSNPFPSGYNAWYGGPGDGGHSSPDWYVQYGMDLGAPGGTPVHAVFDGHVTRLNLGHLNDTTPPFYGAELFVRSHNNLMGCFYTHINQLAPGLAAGATITRGDYLGRVIASPSAPHLHLAIVEIIGGPAANNYKGVNLSSWFRSTANTSNVGTVTFYQNGTAPTVADGGGGISPTGYDLMRIDGIQSALAALGYYFGAITGINDQATKDAVKAFQRDYGLADDGIVGPLTRGALQAALAGLDHHNPVDEPVDQGQTMFPNVRNAIAPFNTPLEGRGKGMYLDIKSLVTTGIGNLIDADSADHFGTNPRLMPEAYSLGWAPPGGAPVSAAAIDAEYQRIKYSGSANWSFPQRLALCQLFITDQAIDDLVARKADSFAAYLRQRPEFAGFATFPADAQLGLLSMAWAMGPAFRFPRFQAAVAAGDWVTAAAESHMDDANNPGLRPRNAINEVVFSIASWVVAPPPGDPGYLYWDTSLSLGDNLKSGNFPLPLNTNAGVQAALELLGFDPHGIDGVFTKASGQSNTQRAIVNFQTANGLSTTPNASKAADIGAATASALATGLDSLGMPHWLP